MKSDEFQNAKYRILCNHCPPVLLDRNGKIRTAVFDILNQSGKNSWSLMLCGHEHKPYRTDVCGVPVLWLGGGESLEAINFAELQSSPDGLRIHSWTGNGKLLYDFTLPPKQ